MMGDDDVDDDDNDDGEEHNTIKRLIELFLK